MQTYFEKTGEDKAEKHPYSENKLDRHSKNGPNCHNLARSKLWVGKKLFWLFQTLGACLQVTALEDSGQWQFVLCLSQVGQKHGVLYLRGGTQSVTALFASGRDHHSPSVSFSLLPFSVSLAQPSAGHCSPWPFLSVSAQVMSAVLPILSPFCHCCCLCCFR
jgi:hypothetical protein